MAQDCNPTLKEIYNYSIGSIFQYKYTTTSYAGGQGNEYTTIRVDKYEIFDKKVQNDTIMLIKKGISTGLSIVPPFQDTTATFTGEIFDTLWIVDSASHYLNACDSQLVYLDLGNDFFSRTLFGEEDGLPAKKVGGYIDGQNNLYEYDENDSLINVLGYEYEQVFVDGVGLLHESYVIFEWSETIELQGYIFNGDTTGTIWNEEDFLTSFEPGRKTIDLKIFPTFITDSELIIISCSLAYDDIQIYSLTGEEYKIDFLSDSKIKLNYLEKGIYILIVDFGNFSISRKIVKY